MIIFTLKIKIMKKLLLMLSFVIGINAIANAQMMKKSPEKRAAHMTKALTKKLSLTTDQANQVNSILLVQATKMDSLKANPSMDKKSDNMTRKTIVLSTKKNILAVLNPDQKARFEQWEKAKMEKRNEKKAQVIAPDTKGIINTNQRTSVENVH